MRDLRDYTATDWLSGRSVVDGVKLVRNTFVERSFRWRGSDALSETIEKVAEFSSGKVAVTIAFNTPWVVELLIRAMGKNLPDTVLVVMDNSTKPAARDEIREICSRRGVPYLALPSNPERHVCRSHGLALNWAYYNFIKPLAPVVFALLDHDLLPQAPFDLRASVARQPVYGVKAASRYGWNLWAGFCVFDFAEVAKFPLDFNTDRPRLLDTGGRNWINLYRHLDTDRISFPEAKYVSVRDPRSGNVMVFESVDGFVHVGHASFVRAASETAKREFFSDMVGRVERGERPYDIVAESA